MKKKNIFKLLAEDGSGEFSGEFIKYKIPFTNEFVIGIKSANVMKVIAEAMNIVNGETENKAEYLSLLSDAVLCSKTAKIDFFYDVIYFPYSYDNLHDDELICENPFCETCANLSS